MKKIILLTIMLIFSFNSCGKEMDSKYLELKKNKDENLELYQYYDQKRARELEKIFLELDEVYKKNQDEKVLKYIEENEDNYSHNIRDYYSKKITEKCDNNCGKRLIKLYSYLYEKTGNIEMLASILKYKENIDESEYNKIKEIVIKNNSVIAIEKDIRQKSREEEEKNISNKIKVNNKNYRIIQEQKLNSGNLYEKVILCTDEKDVYLVLSKSNQNILKKFDSYYGTVIPPYLQIIDLNGDGKGEFVIQYSRNIYIFTFENEKISKIFDGYENILINKYFKYEIDKTDVKTVLIDDFKHNIIQRTDKLPNEKEVISEVLNDNIERKIYYSFIIIKNKIIMNVVAMDDYVYEIIFDKGFKYKVKVIKKKEI